MEKKRLFRILAKGSEEKVHALAEEAAKNRTITVIKEPSKTLTMIKMREPVKESLFYIGEVMVCEAIVMVDGIKGTAVTMGDHFSKVYDMAVIDAVINGGTFTGEEILYAMEKEQKTAEEKENAMHMNTMVNFTSMDSEAAQ